MQVRRSYSTERIGDDGGRASVVGVLRNGRPRVTVSDWVDAAPDGARERGARERLALAGRLLRNRRLVPYLLAVDALAFMLVAALTEVAPLSLLAWAVLAVAMMAGLGLYRHRLTISALDDLPQLLTAAAVSGLALPVLAALPGLGDLTMLPLHALAIGVLAVPGARVPAYMLVRQARRAGGLRHPVLILGAGEVGARIANNLLADLAYGLHPVGFLEEDVQDDHLSGLPLPVLGTPADLRDQVRALNVTRVIVAFGYQREHRLVDVLRTCDRLRCEIFYVPRLFELHNVTRNIDNIRGLPLVRIRRAAFRTWSWRLKRVVDVLLSGTALVALSPLLLACALAVRTGVGPGTILFRQQRVGVDGRPFLLMKFRSLAPRDDTEAQTQWNIALDDRLTTVGRFLRATSLDELPQLWNVCVGDMSLVGPRPERPHFVSEFSERIPRYTGRHRVPAGLTGWSQVNGLRGDTSIEDRARFDNYYIENWSLWLDAKILLRTVTEVLARRGG